MPRPDALPLRSRMLLAGLIAALAGCAPLAGAPAPGHAAPGVPAGAGSGAATGSPAVPVRPLVLGGIAFHSLQWQVRLGALPAGSRAPALQRELQQALDAVDAVLTTYRPSELMRLNAQPVGEWATLSPALARALAVAGETHRLSGGAYDPTVGPLVELWGFGAAPAPAAWPSTADLAAARARVGWRHLAVAGDRVRRDADVRLDLSSLGEGAGVEALARVLAQAGAKDYLVRVAGTALARGRHPDGSPWTLAVEVPDGSGLPGRALAVTDSVVSTSGSYRNIRVVGGRRVSHTLDPATGLPVTHGGVSVTVVLPAAVGADRADALATALNVLGPDRGLALAAERGWAVFYIERDGQGFRERASPAFGAPALPRPRSCLPGTLC